MRKMLPLKRSLHIYVSKKGANIKSLDSQTINSLMANNKLTCILDIYKLKEEDLHPFVSKERAEDIIKEIYSRKDISSGSFVYSLNVPMVLYRTREYLDSAFKDPLDIFKSTKEELIQVPGIRPYIATSILEYYNNPVNANIVHSLLEIYRDINNKHTNKRIKVNLLNENKVYIAGTFGITSKKEIRNIISDYGGVVEKDLTEDVNYVIQGKRCGNDILLAEEFGTIIFSLKEFMKMICCRLELNKFCNKTVIQ